MGFSGEDAVAYSNKFVMCVLINGAIQQEKRDGTLEIPFGTEYALRLRNKHDRRAVAKVYIDGEHVGSWVVPPRSNNHPGYIDIRRHEKIDRAFKFVSLDSADAHEHGKSGDNADRVKGVIEANFHLENVPTPATVVKEIHHHHHHEYVPRPNPFPIRPYWNHVYDGHTVRAGGAAVQPAVMPTSDSGDHLRRRMRSTLGGLEACASNSAVTATNYAAGGATSCLAAMPTSAPVAKDGCTVEGRVTGDRFGTTYIDYDQKNFVSVKIVLRGVEFEARPKANYVTTPLAEPALPVYEEAPKAALFCTGCGNPRNAGDNFCGSCGKKHG